MIAKKLVSHLNVFCLIKASLFFFVRTCLSFLGVIIEAGMYFHQYRLQGTIRVFHFLFPGNGTTFYRCDICYVFLVTYWSQLSDTIVRSSGINTIGILENRQSQFGIINKIWLIQRQFHSGFFKSYHEYDPYEKFKSDIVAFIKIATVKFGACIQDSSVETWIDLGVDSSKMPVVTSLIEAHQTAILFKKFPNTPGTLTSALGLKNYSPTLGQVILKPSENQIVLRVTDLFALGNWVMPFLKGQSPTAYESPQYRVFRHLLLGKITNLINKQDDRMLSNLVEQLNSLNEN